MLSFIYSSSIKKDKLRYQFLCLNKMSLNCARGLFQSKKIVRLRNPYKKFQENNKRSIFKSKFILYLLLLVIFINLNHIQTIGQSIIHVHSKKYDSLNEKEQPESLQANDFNPSEIPIITQVPTNFQIVWGEPDELAQWAVQGGTQWTLQKDNITIETGTIDNNITEITYEFSNWQSYNCPLAIICSSSSSLMGMGIRPSRFPTSLLL